MQPVGGATHAKSTTDFPCPVKRPAAMNAFERHGMDHLSASSCNLFAAQPALWVMERLLKRKAPVGAAAHRGTAVEVGVALGLENPHLDIDTCVSNAEITYRGLTALSGDPKRESEFEAVGPIVRTVLPELRSYGKNVVCQEKIEWRAEGLSVPFVGYVDFRFTHHQILIDLKTQLRLASEIKRAHARQVASYAGQFGNNISARVTYATPKRTATYQLENIAEHTACLVQIGRAIERFLGVSNDAQELAGLLMPDTDAYYFNDPATRQAAWEVYHI